VYMHVGACARSLRWKARPSEYMAKTTPQLTGSWEKVTVSSCSRVYPKFIEFRADGLYSGTGAEPGNTPGWDIGTWEMVSSTQVKISTVNDAIATYEYHLVDDVLVFVDDDKCEFRYRRVNR
jgi:hypothetical protein